jgi:hypothetical protein
MRLASALAAFTVLAFAGGAQAAETAAPDPDLFTAAYAPSTATAADGMAGLSYQPGQGLVRWRRGEATAFGPDQDYSLRLSTATLDANPAAGLMRPGAEGRADGRQAFELTFIRNWTGAVAVQSGRLSLDITPHAGFGLSSAGAQLAEVGALLRVNRALSAVGASDILDGSRLFLFAGANGRATGLNLLSTQALRVRDDPDGDGFVREAQAGFGFSRGALQASLGYTHERMHMKALGEDVRRDDRVGLTLSFRPRR